MIFIYEIEYISRNRLTTNMYSIFQHHFINDFFVVFFLFVLQQQQKLDPQYI